NDDLGKDYLNGIKAGLGDKAAKMIVTEASYEISDPTVDSQILKIKDAGAEHRRRHRCARDRAARFRPGPDCQRTAKARAHRLAGRRALRLAAARPGDHEQ